MAGLDEIQVQNVNERDKPAIDVPSSSRLSYTPPTTDNQLKSDALSPDTISVHSSTPVPGYLDQGRRSPVSTTKMYLKRANAKAGKGLYYRHLNYEVHETPPWTVCIFLGFQHYLIMFGAMVTISMLLMEPLCVAPDDTESQSQIIGTSFVVSGICTMLQCTLGTRLPIVQGASFSFLTPVYTMLSFPTWKCDLGDGASSLNVTMATNYTVSGEPPWMSRMREVQGAIMVSSLFQIVIGFSGIIGLMVQYIGPLSITPTIALIGMGLFDVAANKYQGQWGITVTTMVLIAIFSQYTKNLKIPCISFKKGVGFEAQPFPVAKLFPVILAIGFMWIICGILTGAGVFEKGDKGGTSHSLDVLHHAAWFRIPYPGQWGTPTVSTAGVMGSLAGILTSIVESIGDYYACARMAQVPPPPAHAINRGIGVEGLASLFAGAFGCGTGTTSYSENIGAIGITKVGSRRVVQCASVIMIVFGVFNKFGALFATIPEPIVGGLFIVMLGMIVAIGLSNLQFVDLNSSRNLFIIGTSFFFGITLPSYMKLNKEIIKTGSIEFDQVLTVLLQTNMFVGGLTGFLLDNTIPGTDEERGIVNWRSHMPSVEVGKEPTDCYDIPSITNYLKKYSWTRNIPFLPTYQPKKLWGFQKWRVLIGRRWRRRDTLGAKPEISIQECTQ